MLLSRLFLILLLSFSGIASAADSAQTEHLNVRLIHSAQQNGDEADLWLALDFRLIPHWHIYWRNPGDSGTAPEIDWQLPEGWQAGEIQWPVPERIPAGPFINYGYEEQVSLLVPVKTNGIPAKATEQIQADARWLVCREECIPEEASLKIDPTQTATLSKAALETARSRLPVPLAINASYQIDDNRFQLTLNDLGWQADSIESLWFAANDWGVVEPSAPQDYQFAEQGLQIKLPPGDNPPDGTQAFDGLMVVTEKLGNDTITRGFELTLTSPTSGGSDTGSQTTLISAVLFALLGGLILNLMPCVLPILSIKVLGFVEQAHAERSRMASLGLAYGAGVVLSFLALAGLLLALRAGGESLGWGFQLQSPTVVALMTALMLLIALNLSGVFEFGHRLMGVGQNMTQGHGWQNAFMSGGLAVLVASPCTAPFMGSALGYALTQSAASALLIFAALGLGFALPVVLLSFWPGWSRYLPKPGMWMEHLRRFLAFPMYGAALWLLWILAQQVDASALAFLLAALLTLAMAAWLYGQKPLGKRFSTPVSGLLAAVAVVTLFSGDDTIPSAEANTQSSWSADKVSQHLAEGRPVFSNFTAAWCITCKVNERVALSTDAVQQAMRDKGIVYLKGDWTRRDAAITQALSEHGRSGVPLYLLHIPGQDNPKVLPQILTEGMLLEAFDTLNP